MVLQKRLLEKFFPRVPIVNFICVGAQKSGTTTLFAFLKEHPQIYLPETKEIHFFDNDTEFRGVINYDSYEMNFSHATDQKAIGEVTPIYMYWPHAIKRIHDYNPRMKIILILRNPIERAYSHWSMMRREKKEKLSFLDGIKMEQERISNADRMTRRIFSYIDRGFYTIQIRNIFHYFDKEDISIIKFEDFIGNPEAVLKRLFTFLGVVDYAYENNSKHLSIGSYQTVISRHERNVLKGIFEQEIMELENMLSWDCRSWMR